MAKLTINLDPNTHANLKAMAEDNQRSLTQYIHLVLQSHARDIEQSQPNYT